MKGRWIHHTTTTTLITNIGLEINYVTRQSVVSRWQGVQLCGITNKRKNERNDKSWRKLTKGRRDKATHLFMCNLFVTRQNAHFLYYYYYILMGKWWWLRVHQTKVQPKRQQRWMGQRLCSGWNNNKMITNSRGNVLWHYFRVYMYSDYDDRQR